MKHLVRNLTGRIHRVIVVFAMLLIAQSARAVLMDFGKVLAGTSSDATFTLYNVSGTNITYQIPAPASPFSHTGGNLSGTIPPHGSNDITFTFQAPVNYTPGQIYQQTLHCTSSGSPSSFNLILQGSVSQLPFAVVQFGSGVPACIGTPATLDGSHSYDPDNPSGSSGIVSWKWVISGGTGFRKEFSGSVIQFVPSAFGTYSVNLWVTDDEGQVGLTSQSLEVQDPNPVLIVPSYCLDAYFTRVLASANNGQVEIQCVGGAFQVRWRSSGSSSPLYIATCRYNRGNNAGQYEINRCNNEITRVCWANWETNPNDVHGECANAIDNDFYCFDVTSGTLTIIKRCQSVDGLERAMGPQSSACGCSLEGQTPWARDKLVWQGPAPTDIDTLRCKFQNPNDCPGVTDRISGAESRPGSTYTDFFRVARPGQVSLRVFGTNIVIQLLGGESALTIAQTLATAINTNYGLTNFGVFASVLPARVDDGGVQFNLFNVRDRDRQWETVGQSSSGLTLISAADIPWLDLKATGTNLLITCQPSGAGYFLQSSSTLQGGSNAWQTLSVTNGLYAFSPVSKQAFFRVVFTGKPSAAARPPGLLSWWTGDDTAHDLVSTNHGTFTNGVSFVAGTIGQAFMLDGVSGWVDFGQGAAVTGKGPFSVALWLKTTQATAKNLATQQTGTDTNGMWSLSLQAGKLRWFTYGESAYGFDTLSARSVNDGQAHFVVCTRESNGSGRLYIDGTLDSSQAGTARTLVSLNVTIGAGLRDLATAALPSFFNGMLDEVQIYGRSLATNEITAIYNAGQSGISKLQ